MSLILYGLTAVIAPLVGLSVFLLVAAVTKDSYPTPRVTSEGTTPITSDD